MDTNSNFYHYDYCSKNTSCPTSTAATTSRGGKTTQAAPLSLSEQIMQGAANAKRHSPQSSSASSEGNDDAAMAVIMSLLEVSSSASSGWVLFLSYFRLTLVLVGL